MGFKGAGRGVGWGGGDVGRRQRDTSTVSITMAEKKG